VSGEFTTEDFYKGRIGKSGGDLDIWVEPTKSNSEEVYNCLVQFGQAGFCAARR